MESYVLNTDLETIKYKETIKIFKMEILKEMTYLEVDKFIFDENKNLIGVIGTARDITEQILLKRNEYLMCLIN